jgi:murein DD-endopeptidase MepM/ murein hydrolase activator NlpD
MKCMTLKKFFQTVVLAVSVVCLLQTLCSAASKSSEEIERDLKTEEQRLDKIQNQINESKKRERVAVQQEKKVIRDITNLSNELSKKEQLHNITVVKKNQVSNKISEILAKIELTSKSIDEAKRLLNGRVVAMYKYGTIAEFELFMSASGAQEALSTSYLLSRIAEQDKALIENLSMQKDTLDKAHAELMRQKQELDNRDKELKKQKASIQKTTQDRNKLLQQVRKDKALFQAQQAELLRASRDLQKKVQQLLAAKKKMQQQSRGGNTPLYYKGGRLAWPLRGQITSPYGGRIHPVFKTRTTHTGIDISGDKGDPVRTAEDGEVLYTGWLRGYGQVVIIDHGGNLTTVYAHLSGIDTSENAKVKTGDKIGRVGSTGTTTGNHLHFEVRINGNTTDPMGYLNK